MQLLEDICRHRSVAIAGLAKNAGKTECLNYILRHAGETGRRFAITSIGVDGENRDQVTDTHKPEITLSAEMYFVTSEMHYRQKRLTAEILDLSTYQTSLGRLVTARAVDSGKVILSGPADTATVRRLITSMQGLGVQTTIVDGALSRLSLSAPEVTDAMVLATGAALSPNIQRIVQQTRYVYDLISLPRIEGKLAEALGSIQQGVRTVDTGGGVHDPGIQSAYMVESRKDELFRHGKTIYVAGAVSEKLMKFLASQREVKGTVLIMKDFTRMFAEPQTYYTFLRKGGSVKVLHTTQLIAVTVNPRSPQGYTVDTGQLQDALRQHISVPVYDVMEIQKKEREQSLQTA